MSSQKQKTIIMTFLTI